MVGVVVTVLVAAARLAAARFAASCLCSFVGLRVFKRLAGSRKVAAGAGDCVVSWGSARPWSTLKRKAIVASEPANNKHILLFIFCLLS